LPLEVIFHQILCFFVDGTDLHLRRLRIEKPEVTWLGIDTMVVDNDYAHQREKVTPTYKKVKGFQPLQVFWNRMIADASLREGKAHSNHGNHVVRIITELVRLIRSHYDENVAICVVADTGFYDQRLFDLCDRLNIAFIVGRKIYKNIAEYIAKVLSQQLQECQKDRNLWEYCEFGDRRGSWNVFRRAIYTKPVTDDEGQGMFEFARPETIIYTNLGTNRNVTAAFSRALGSKEFGTEHVPFKQDMDTPVIPVTCTPRHSAAVAWTSPARS